MKKVIPVVSFGMAISEDKFFFDHTLPLDQAMGMSEVRSEGFTKDLAKSCEVAFDELMVCDNPNCEEHKNQDCRRGMSDEGFSPTDFVAVVLEKMEPTNLTELVLIMHFTGAWLASKGREEYEKRQGAASGLGKLLASLQGLEMKNSHEEEIKRILNENEIDISNFSTFNSNASTIAELFNIPKDREKELFFAMMATMKDSFLAKLHAGQVNTSNDEAMQVDLMKSILTTEVKSADEQLYIVAMAGNTSKDFIKFHESISKGAGGVMSLLDVIRKRKSD